jgi:hypothetical protein
MDVNSLTIIVFCNGKCFKTFNNLQYMSVPVGNDFNGVLLMNDVHH